MLWGLAIGFIAVLAAGGLYLRSGAFEEWLGREAVRILESRFPVRAELERIRLHPWGPEVVLEGLRLSSREFPQADPDLEIRRASLNLSVLGYFLPRISLDRLTLTDPRLRIYRTLNGKLNLSNMFDQFPKQQGQAEFSPARIGIRELSIQSGLILYRDRVFRVETQRGGMTGELRFVSPEAGYSGRFGLQGLDLRVNQIELTRLASDLRFLWTADQLRFPSVTLQSEQLEAQLRGGFASLRKLRYRFQAQITADLTLWKSPLLSEYFQQGRVQAIGQLWGEGADPQFEGAVRSDRVHFVGFDFRDLVAQLRVDRKAATVHSLQSRLGGGPGCERPAGLGTRAGLAVRRLGQPRFHGTAFDETGLETARCGWAGQLPG